MFSNIHDDLSSIPGITPEKQPVDLFAGENKKLAEKKKSEPPRKKMPCLVERLGYIPFRKGEIIVGVGTRTDKEGIELIYLDEKTMRLHTMILGATGSGKTVLLSAIINQAIMQGWGILLADMKFDPGLFNTAYYTAYKLGRHNDFRLINPFAIDTQGGLLGGLGCHSYNPLISINSSISQTAALLKAAEKGGKSKTAYWDDVKEEIVSTLVNAFLSTGRPYSFKDMWFCLEKPEGLQKLICEARDPEAIAVMKGWHERWTADPRQTEQFKQFIQGAKMFFAALGTGVLGQMFNTYHPDVSLAEAYDKNQIVWTVLPSLTIDNTARAVGRMILSDLRYLAGNIQAMSTNRKQFLVVVDEFENFAFDGVTDLFDKGRAAGVAMVIAFQSPKQIDKEASKEVRDIIVANTRNKIVLATEDIEVAKPISELLGSREYTSSVSLKDVSIREADPFLISPTKISQFQDFEMAIKSKDNIWEGNVVGFPSGFEPGVDMPRPRFIPNLSREGGIRIFEEVADID